MIGLLRLVAENSDAVESDLSFYHQIDYRDRWRFDAAGHRRLTLRMISVRVRRLPLDSATARATGGTGWTLQDHLLADVFHATAGKPHPGLPAPAKGWDRNRDKAIRAAKARRYERQRAINAGEIT